MSGEYENGEIPKYEKYETGEIPKQVSSCPDESGQQENLLTHLKMGELGSDIFEDEERRDLVYW